MDIQMKDIQLRMPKFRKIAGRYSKSELIILNNELKDFADDLISLGRALKKKVSARGWCYLLENLGKITKNEFDIAETYINKCRYQGLIPIDFIEMDKSRAFSHLENLKEETQSAEDFLIDRFDSLKNSYSWKKDIGFWESQKVYIQMMVEKKDVFNIFYSICDKYHIPIANAKGWSDINSRYELAMRFKEADEMGLKCVLLYFGDHDPAGIMISDTLHKNITDLSEATKWDASKMIIDRFGLNYDFVIAHKLLWIENLITGSGKPADKSKKFIKDYIAKFGERKCEANAVLVVEDESLLLCEATILKYLGKDPLKDWNERIEKEQNLVLEKMKELKMDEQIDAWISILKKQTSSPSAPLPLTAPIAAPRDEGKPIDPKKKVRSVFDDEDDPGIFFKDSNEDDFVFGDKEDDD